MMSTEHLAPSIVGQEGGRPPQGRLLFFVEPSRSRPTTGSEQSVCCTTADANSEGDRPVVGPGAFPTPLRAGVTSYFDGNLGRSASPVPILAALPLDCDAGGISNLDPDRART